MTGNKAKIRQSFSKAALTYDSVAHLQRTVGQELLQLTLPKNFSGITLDLGCGTGFSTQLLLPHCLDSNVMIVDLALPMLHTAKQKLKQRVDYICADVEHLPLQSKTINTVFSNLALQWCWPINPALLEIYRVLVDGGELIFSTFGTQTLHELKNAWAKLDNYVHVNPFYTAQALQIALSQIGFTVSKTTSKYHSCLYPDVFSLMHELKNLGAHHVQREGNMALSTPKKLKKLIEYYPQEKSGKIVATYEVISFIIRK
jgi:malonyl-CoA O-methyltransferase